MQSGLFEKVPKIPKLRIPATRSSQPEEPAPYVALKLDSYRGDVTPKVTR
jgi:hypothetical protein